MKKIGISLVMFLYGIVQAQNADTQFFKKMYHRYIQSPIYLNEIDLKNFTCSALYFNNEQGNLHLGQQPTQATDFGLTTYGLYQTGKLAFFGNIDVNRNYQQDKKWNLSYAEVSEHGLMPDPHYYAVSKFSDWNNQKYQIQGGLVLPVIAQKWNLALGTDYTLSENYRTTYDPRPKIVTNLLSFSAQTGVQITQKHKVGIGFSYLKQHINNNISFSDDDSQTPFYYPKYLRWMLGYGTMFFPTSSSTQRNLYKKHFIISHHYKSGKTKWLNAFMYTSATTDTYRNAHDENTDQDVVASLFSKKQAFTSNYLQAISENTDLMLALLVSQKNNSNHLQQQNGKNYAASFKKVTFEAHLLQNKHRAPQELSLQMYYRHSSQKDVLAKTKSEVTTFETSLFGNKTYYLLDFELTPFVKFGYIHSEHALSDANDISYRMIHENDFSSKALKLFYNEVVYHDHFLLNKPRYRFLLGVDFKKHLKAEVKVVWNVSSEYLSTFEKNNRYFWSSSLTFYY